MKELTPDFTIANNSHAFIHCGGTDTNIKDPQHDLILRTSGKCESLWNKNGNKTERVNGIWSEESGLDSNSKGPTRKILTRNGDIHLIADDGDIYLKAKNVYVETSGEKPNGCFLVNANGQIIITGQDNVKVASGTNLCLAGKSKVTLVGTQLISSGKFIDSGPASTGDFISQFMAGNFQGLVNGILQSCK